MHSLEENCLSHGTTFYCESVFRKTMTFESGHVSPHLKDHNYYVCFGQSRIHCKCFASQKHCSIQKGFKHLFENSLFYIILPWENNICYSRKKNRQVARPAQLALIKRWVLSIVYVLVLMELVLLSLQLVQTYPR